MSSTKEHKWIRVGKERVYMTDRDHFYGCTDCTKTARAPFKGNCEPRSMKDDASKIAKEILELKLKRRMK